MSKPSSKKNKGAAPSAKAAAPSLLAPKTLRFVLNPNHPSGVERIDWRGPGTDAPVLPYPLDRKQSIDSLRALAIAMLCLNHCRNGRAHELSELGTVLVEKIRGGWEIKAVKQGKTWLQTLGNAYDQRGEKNDKDDSRKPTSPFGKLLNALPALVNEQTPQWKASRADDSGLPSFWCQDYKPSDTSPYGGPNLRFCHLIEETESPDLPDTTDWLALARQMEKSHRAWKPLLQSPKLPELDPAPLARYFQHLVSECRHLPLIAIDEKATNPEECAKLDLSNIYVELGTQLREKREPSDGPPEGEPTVPGRRYAAEHFVEGDTLSALRAVAQFDRLVLTGSPGSGKTTFTRHFSLCFARRALQPKASAPKGLTDWPEDAPRFLVPIIIELRRFARSLPEKTLKEKQPGSRELWDFFTKAILDGDNNQSGHKLTDLDHLLEDAVAEGHAVVFFEGLDEVPTGDQRDYVRRAVMAFAGADHFKASRVVLTCRTRAYSQKGFPLNQFTEAPLTGFSEEQIDAFIEAWYHEIAPLNNLARDEANRRARDLRERVRLPSLWELAPTPLLLTVMTHVHASKNELPETRAKVYAQMVDILLSRWDSMAKSDFAPMKQLLAEKQRDTGALRQALSKLAFKLRGLRRSRSSDKQDTGDIPRHELLEALAEIPTPPDYNWANRAIDTIEQRSGLIAPDGEDSKVFTSPHPSFQEYLAGAHLAADLPDMVAESIELAKDVSGYWDETILWAAGYTAHVSDMPKFWRDVPELADALCNEAPSGSELKAHHVGLAGEILLEAGRSKLEQIRGGLDCLHRVRQGLTLCMQQEGIALKARESCGIVLGRLGDERDGVRIIPKSQNQLARPHFVWCGPDPNRPRQPFPKGPFLMGGDSKAYGCSPEPFNCTRIDRPFFISKFPITVAQYQLFIEAGGYGELGKSKPAWWTNSGWKWRMKDEEVSGRPDNYQPVFQTSNHPRVGVNWFEAVAYCGWLNAAFSPEELGMPDKNWKIRLPTDAQWERAARHPDGRFLPWGNEDSEAELTIRCNWEETGIDHTSAVGLFSKGNAACGAADMVGNVWEWCQSKWVKLHDKHAQDAYNRDTTLDDADSPPPTAVVHQRSGEPALCVPFLRHARLSLLRRWVSDGDGG